MLESVDSAPISIHPVARLLSGPVQAPDATDGQKVRSCRDHTPEPPESVVLLPKNTEFSNGDSWWWPDDSETTEAQALPMTGRKSSTSTKPWFCGLVAESRVWLSQ